MNFKHKMFSLMTAMVAFFALSVFASAQQTTPNSDSASDRNGGMERHDGMKHGEGRGMRGGKGGEMMRGLHRLDLTDAQKQQIKSLMESTRAVNEPLQNEVRSLVEKKRGGTELTEVERARLTEIKTQMRQSHEQVKLQVEAILTAEQRQQLNQMKEEMKKRHEGRRQMRKQRNQPMTEKSDTIN